MKQLFSLILLFVVILPLTACRAGDEIISPILYYGITTEMIVYGGLILIILFLIIRFFVNDAKRVKERQKEIERKEAERKARNHKVYKDSLADYISRLGACTIDINLGAWNEYNIKKHLFVFEESQIIVINQKEYKFVDILGCSLVDEATSETIMESIGEANTSTGGMIGRAVIGGIISGGLGAAVGAATAKRNTSNLVTGTSTTTHKYMVFVNINSLENPTEKLFIGNNSDKAYKMMNILNVIIERNKMQ